MTYFDPAKLHAELRASGLTSLVPPAPPQQARVEADVAVLFSGMRRDLDAYRGAIRDPEIVEHGVPVANVERMLDAVIAVLDRLESQWGRLARDHAAVAAQHADLARRHAALMRERAAPRREGDGV